MICGLIAVDNDFEITSPKGSAVRRGYVLLCEKHFWQLTYWNVHGWCFKAYQVSQSHRVQRLSNCVTREIARQVNVPWSWLLGWVRQHHLSKSSEYLALLATASFRRKYTFSEWISIPLHHISHHLLGFQQWRAIGLISWALQRRCSGSQLTKRVINLPHGRVRCPTFLFFIELLWLR